MGKKQKSDTKKKKKILKIQVQLVGAVSPVNHRGLHLY